MCHPMGNDSIVAVIGLGRGHFFISCTNRLRKMLFVPYRGSIPDTVSSFASGITLFVVL